MRENFGPNVVVLLSWEAGDAFDDAIVAYALNGVHAGPDVMEIQGRAPTLEATKADLQANWEKWLAWAKPGED